MGASQAHTTEVSWDLDWRHLGWYVNLQAPLVVDGSRFDTMDWALDIVVEPDWEWSWKDEHHLAEADAVRAEGERVVAACPWPTGWEDWRPPPDWTPLPLPDGWADAGV